MSFFSSEVRIETGLVGGGHFTVAYNFGGPIMIYIILNFFLGKQLLLDLLVSHKTLCMSLWLHMVNSSVESISETNVCYFDVI